MYQLNAGYSGELDVDRVLIEIGLPKDVMILKDLTVEVLPNFYVQLDTLMITPKRLILLEVKNYAGTVIFDEASGKTTKISAKGETEKLDCIIHQIDRAANGVKRWLEKNGFHLPIEPIIVMANQRTIIPEMPNSVPLKYIKQLPKYIRELDNTPDILSQQQIITIANRLKADHMNWRRTPACERFAIPASDLKRGVLCLRCNNAMERSRGRTWICKECKKPSKAAMEQAVADWYHLISPTLTNKQLRNFLELNSNSAASIIFRKLRLNRTGKPPRTIYRWDYKMPLNKNKINR